MIDNEFSIRKNIISWYEFKENANILQIGFDKELTNYLVTITNKLTIVDYSEIDILQINNINNISINIVNSLEKISNDEKFDYIIVIGTLKYAFNFLQSNNPYELLLNKLREKLNLDGKLLLSIENRLGLKYWLGAREETTNLKYEGIKGYKNLEYMSRTFSKNELETLLNKVGFENLFFYYPMPNYKYPDIIFSEKCLPKVSNCKKYRTIYETEENLNFSEYEAIEEIVKNNMFEKMSNSFFVECSLNKNVKLGQVSFIYFNNIRKKEFSTMVKFKDDKVYKYANYVEGIEHLKNISLNNKELAEKGIKTYKEEFDYNKISMNYIDKPSAEEIIVNELLNGKKDTIYKCIDLLIYELDKLDLIEDCELNALQKYGIECDFKEFSPFIRKAYIDMDFSNCFIENDELVFFDQEWSECNVPKSYIIYRAINNLYIRNHELKKIVPKEEIFLKYDISLPMVESFDKLENEFLKNVIENNVQSFYDKNKEKENIDELLKKVQNELIKERENGILKDNEIEKLDTKVNELDLKIETLSKNNEELNNQIQNLNSQINALRKVINDYDNSLSWKVTKPLRYISIKSRNLLKKTKNNVQNIQSSSKINIYDEKAKKLNINNPKKVSVVIPNYNYADYIIERIDSVLLQTYPIYEIVILDDCSKDNSIEVIKNKIKTIKNVNIRLIENKTNGGSVFGQWKKGFNLANGDYVWIAEADDSSNPRFLETVMKGFDDEKTVISYCESLTIDTENNLLMRDLREWIDIFKTGKWDNNYIVDGKNEITSTICINNTIANVSSVVFKKANYDDFFDKAREFALAGDWYFYIKVLEQGKVAYFKESLNYHRMHNKGVTLTTKNEKHYEEICYIQDYILNNYKLTDEVKERIYIRREEVKRRFNIDE